MTHGCKKPRNSCMAREVWSNDDYQRYIYASDSILRKKRLIGEMRCKWKRTWNKIQHTDKTRLKQWKSHFSFLTSHFMSLVTGICRYLWIHYIIQNIWFLSTFIKLAKFWYPRIAICLRKTITFLTEKKKDNNHKTWKITYIFLLYPLKLPILSSTLYFTSLLLVPSC
jgi:hypothetical protein